MLHVAKISFISTQEQHSLAQSRSVHSLDKLSLSLTASSVAVKLSVYTIVRIFSLVLVYPLRAIQQREEGSVKSVSGTRRSKHQSTPLAMLGTEHSTRHNTAPCSIPASPTTPPSQAVLLFTHGHSARKSNRVFGLIAIEELHRAVLSVREDTRQYTQLVPPVNTKGVKSPCVQ